MIEFYGYLGAFCLALCALPQAIQCFRTKTAKGINGLFLSLWFLGEITTLVYVLFKFGLDIPLVLNYTFNILLLTIIIRYKVSE